MALPCGPGNRDGSYQVTPSQFTWARPSLTAQEAIWWSFGKAGENVGGGTGPVNLCKAGENGQSGGGQRKGEDLAKLSYSCVCTLFLFVSARRRTNRMSGVGEKTPLFPRDHRSR